MPDAELAALTKLSHPSVYRRRCKLGIPPFGRQGTRRRKWTDAEVELLGTMPDQAVADRLGLYASTVTDERGRRKIPKFCRRNTVLPEYVKLLGKVPDYRVAELTGLGKASVRRMRNERGIPPANRGGPKSRNIANKEFGRLVAIQPTGKPDEWLCDCKCGTKNFKANRTNLVEGRTTSCGCRREEYHEFIRTAAKLWKKMKKREGEVAQ
jgi:hypothetical protein